MQNRRAKHALALGISSIFFAGSVSAQSPAPAALPSPVNIREAVERAILQNPEVKLRFHNFQAAQYDKKAAAGAWLPRIDLEATSGSATLKTPALASTLNYPSNQITLQLRQTLFDGFAARHEGRRLSYTQLAAYYDLLTSSNQTGLEAARTYIDVLRYRELIRLASENFATHQEVHDRISQKVAAGVGRRVDLEQAAGRLALAESNWLTEASNFHDVSARYQRLVGDTPAETLAPLGPLDEFLPIGTEFLADAAKKSPDLLGAIANIRAYRADSKARRASMYPTIELRARQSLEANQNGITGDYTSSALQVVLSYNLYRGGTDRDRIDQYVAKMNSALDLREKACRDIWQTGQIAFNDSIRLVAQLKLLSQHELSTSKARQAYQQQFEIGQRSLLDLLDTENELYQARRALTNGEFDLNLAEVRVLANAGTLLNALKLTPLLKDVPETTGEDEEEDELTACNQRILPTLTLARNTESRLAPLPSAPNPTTLATAPAPAPALVAGATAAAAAAAPKAMCDALPKTVETWLNAWNRKDVPGYLGAYSASFVPSQGMNRKQWEAMRTARISKQGDAQITVGKIVPVKCDALSAEVTFPQVYGSANYKDKVEKTLSLENVKGAWKITKELVTKGRTP